MQAWQWLVLEGIHQHTELMLQGQGAPHGPDPDARPSSSHMLGVCRTLHRGWPLCAGAGNANWPSLAPSGFHSMEAGSRHRWGGRSWGKELGTGWGWGSPGSSLSQQAQVALCKSSSSSWNSTRERPPQRPNKQGPEESRDPSEEPSPGRGKGSGQTQRRLAEGDQGSLGFPAQKSTLLEVCVCVASSCPALCVVSLGHLPMADAGSAHWP